MKTNKIVLFVLFFTLLALLVFLLPFKQAILFTEMRTSKEIIHYVPLDKSKSFQIRYVHSIHLSDVIESYEVTTDGKIRLLSMTYEDLAIGLPGYAGEGETMSLTDGLYTLTYDDKVINSFTMRIGNIDTDLAFRYEGNEIDLKEHLERGKSYEFKITKLTLYQILKGVNLNVER